MPTTTIPPLHSPDFYAGDPYPAYRELRNSTPVVWNDVTNFWALSKYEDVRFVSGNPHKFSSTKGITIPDPTQPEPVQEGNLIFTDPPRHRQLRKLINSGFTRRQVTLLEPKVREIVKNILDDVEPGREYEFAEQIAAPLPTRMIARCWARRRRTGSSSERGRTRRSGPPTPPISRWITSPHWPSCTPTSPTSSPTAGPVRYPARTICCPFWPRPKSTGGNAQ